MELSLKNIGKIDTAVVEINGITVIAGENNTGKSTVGKALFAIFNSFYNIDRQILNQRKESINKVLDLIFINSIINVNSLFDDKLDYNKQFISNDIIKNIDVYRVDNSKLKDMIFNNIPDYNESSQYYTDIDIYINRIIEIINISNDEIFQSLLKENFDKEFNGQISNIFSDDFGEIKLKIKNQVVTIKIKDKDIINIENSISLNTEIVYIDDPFVLDETLYSGINSILYSDHRNHLKSKLSRINEKNTNIIDKIIINNKFEKIYEKINIVCSGDIIKDKNYKFNYKNKNTEKVIDLRNLSTGLKTFVILKMLLLNGTISYNGTIILDEPEIHLHPEWQLLFAEIIVLIHKEFKMHILLNTHSPYFLRAIQVYSAKYDVADKCKYYLSEVDNDKASIFDVTNDIEKIYVKLSRPLQVLENERWQYD